MLLNTGLDFKNINGSYKICLSKDIPAFHVELSPYYDKAIVTVYEFGLHEVYSHESLEKHSVALEFAGINENDVDSILAFCNKYGLLTSSKTLFNERNDYLFMDIPKNDFAQVMPVVETEWIYLFTFQKEVINMRMLLKLHEAILKSDCEGIVETLTYFCFDHSVDFDRDMLYRTESCSFNHSFRCFLEEKTGSSYDVSSEYRLSEIIRSYLQSMEEDLYADHVRGHNFPYLIENEEIYHTTWQQLHTLFSNLLDFCDIDEVSPFGIVAFSKSISELTPDALCPHPGFLVLLANAVLMDRFNETLYCVHPEMHYLKGHLLPNWRISSLLEAMYLELFFRITPYTRLKKCANPSCRNYFEVSSENSRKIYCDNRCAQLMAKRMQRKRERENT